MRHVHVRRDDRGSETMAGSLVGRLNLAVGVLNLALIAWLTQLGLR